MFKVHSQSSIKSLDLTKDYIDSKSQIEIKSYDYPVQAFVLFSDWKNASITGKIPVPTSASAILGSQTTVSYDTRITALGTAKASIPPNGS